MTISLRSLSVLIATLCWFATASACGPAQPNQPTPDAPAPDVADSPRAVLEQQFLDMFARAYYPGRSGQIMLVPERGNILLEPDDSFYRFMHGSPWAYDVDVPLLAYGLGHIRHGVFDEPVTHRDVAPIIAALLDLPVTATMSGKAPTTLLTDAIKPPRAVFLAVLDGARTDFFDRYADTLPTFRRLRAEGAWFSGARVDYLPSLTSVGHASIATGAEPLIHGIVANTMFDQRTGQPSGPFPETSPANLSALTITDLWNLRSRGRAAIIAQGTTSRATVPMAGHGGCLLNAHPTIMAMFDAVRGGWVTNDECYRLPFYVASDTAARVLQRRDTWLGHDVRDGRTLLRSGWFTTYQVDALVSMIERERVGQDEISDLVLANFKTLDYVGHRWGPNSDELAAALRDLDRELGRVVAALESAAGPDGFVVIVTSDHGTPGEPEAPEQGRYYITDIIETIHNRFDPDERRTVLYYGDPADNQIFIDRSHLNDLGFNLGDIATHLEALPFIFAAYTEDEVAAAISH